MIADVFGLLNELKSKVDVLSLGHTDSGRLPNDPARAAAPGPEKKEPTVKVEPVAITQQADEEDSDYKEDFESTFKNSENGLLESSE